MSLVLTNRIPFLKQKLSHSIFFILAFICGSLLPLNAYAFKVQTHVWVGQQVINDLESNNGYVTIELKDGSVRRFYIDENLTKAILENKGSYRMGNIGPDAFPDIYTGQMVIHPGLPNDPDGWQTDDWLKFLLNSKNTILHTPEDEKIKDPQFMCQKQFNCLEPQVVGEMTGQQRAFVYGYLGHAAADTFAHTYVNFYSGDVFDVLKDLSEGVSVPDATVEEVRHIELEKYIASFQPPMEDANGQYLGEPHALLETPNTFLMNKLIFNDEVAQRNLAAGAPHLTAIHELRKFLVSSELEAEFHNMDKYAITEIVKQISKRYGYEIVLTDTQAHKMVIYWKEVHRFLKNTDGTDQIQDMHMKIGDGLRSLVNMTQDMETQYNDSLTAILTAVTAVDNLVLQIAQAEAEKTALLLSYAEKACSSLSCPTTTTVLVPTWWGGWEWATVPYTDPVCEVVKATCTQLNSDISTITATITSLAEAKLAADAKVQEAIDFRQVIVDEYSSIVINAINIEQTIFYEAIDLVESLASNDINFVRGHRDVWVKDIELAMDAYITTSAEVIKASMNGGDAIALYNQWSDCWSQPLSGGLPSQVTITGCKVSDSIGDMQKSFDTLTTSLEKIFIDVQKLIDIRNEILNKAETLAKKAIDELVNSDPTAASIKVIYDAFKAPASDENLLNVFGSDRSTGGYKRLVEFPDIVERIQSDMGVYTRFDGKRIFNVKQFSAMKNAITLAKLTLLNASQLNELAGKISYDVNSPDPVNILVGAIKSIDGNHQWMRTAPPLPRRLDKGQSVSKDFYNVGWPADSIYGYSINNVLDNTNKTKHGFIFWDDCALRDSVFRQIFQGPMSPAFEVANDVGFATLLYKKYPYDVTVVNPFPDTDFNGNTTCGK